VGVTVQYRRVRKLEGETKKRNTKKEKEEGRTRRKE
jgi:hypothetical protein